MTPAELARKVRELQISARHTVTEVFAGEYASAFKGRGMEFSEVREYQPGDEIRTIDWNVTARAGKPYVKRFTEERELSVMLMVDLSASGDFGTQTHTRRALAVEVAAVLAFAAARQGDRVGLLLFTDHVELYLPPTKGGRHALRLVRELLAFEPTGRRTSLLPAAEHFVKLATRRSTVFIVSDFAIDDLDDALSALGSRHDVVGLRVIDPRDMELVPAGVVDVIDPETGTRTTLDTSSKSVQAAWREHATDHAARVATTLRGSGADLSDLWTDRDYVPELIRLFKRREHRR